MIKGGRSVESATGNYKLQWNKNGGFIGGKCRRRCRIFGGPTSALVGSYLLPLDTEPAFMSSNQPGYRISVDGT